MYLTIILQEKALKAQEEQLKQKTDANKQKLEEKRCVVYFNLHLFLTCHYVCTM